MIFLPKVSSPTPRLRTPKSLGGAGTAPPSLWCKCGRKFARQPPASIRYMLKDFFVARKSPRARQPSRSARGQRRPLLLLGLALSDHLRHTKRGIPYQSDAALDHPFIFEPGSHGRSRAVGAIRFAKDLHAFPLVALGKNSCPKPLNTPASVVRQSAIHACDSQCDRYYLQGPCAPQCRIQGPEVDDIAASAQRGRILNQGRLKTCRPQLEAASDVPRSCARNQQQFFESLRRPAMKVVPKVERIVSTPPRRFVLAMQRTWRSCPEPLRCAGGSRWAQLRFTPS